jgi:pimeloyl-ACP methyl ester carboxylesterase
VPSPNLPDHSARRLRDPDRWVIYLSRIQPERLVVFVHGFGGKAVSTWQQFPDGGATSEWWRAADMLFVGYNSKRDDIGGTADRIRHAISRFYPELPVKILQAAGVSVRPHSQTRYSELVLVGHSLGGVIVRCALCDAAERWNEQRNAAAHAPKPVLLEARVRLFSPASAGFRAAGLLGVVKASGLWPAIEMICRRSSAYSDLQPGSVVLADIRERTERYAKDPDLRALRASILWAHPDDVVIPVHYSTDFADDSVDGATHSSVCKPHSNYHTPWMFVEKGDLGLTGPRFLVQRL